MLIRIKDTVIDLRAVEIIQFNDLYKSIKIIFSSGYEQLIDFTKDQSFFDLKEFFCNITPDLLTEEGRNIFVQTSRFLTKHQFGLKNNPEQERPPRPKPGPDLENVIKNY
jgi:hypothetical protein